MSARLVANGLVLLLASVAQVAWAKPICFPTPILDAREYQNIDYQFSVKIPPGLHACKISSPCPNHGIWLPLRGDLGCNDVPRAPYIDVDAEYNAAEEADTATGLAAIQCRWRSAHHIVWLRGERLGGRQAAGCRRDFSDGHVEVSILMLRKTGAWAAQWIEVRADLITTPSRYDSDMSAFRRVLPSIWVHSDEPDD